MRTTLTCHRQLRGPTLLFICAFHLFPSVQLRHSSRRARGDLARRCLGWSSSRLPIVPVALWQKTKAEMCLYTTSVGAFVPSAPQRTRRARMFLKPVSTVQCFSAQIMFPTHTVYIGPLGGSEKLQLRYWLHAASAKHRPGPDCRNRCTKFKTSLHTIDHVNVRLSYKCRGEVNVTPHGGVKRILCYISNSWY